MVDEEKICFKSENLPTFTERGFQPILKMFCSTLDNYDLQPVDTLEGKSIKPLSDGIEKPFLIKPFLHPFNY